MDDSFYNTDFDSPNCINTGCDVFLISTLLHVVITMKHTSCNQHLIKFDKYLTGRQHHFMYTSHPS